MCWSSLEILSINEIVCTFCTYSGIYYFLNVILDPKETTDDCVVKEESSIPDSQELVAVEINVT